MWKKNLVFFSCGLVFSIGSFSQSTKQFFVEDTTIEKINLSLSVDAGDCQIKSSKQEGLLNIYSNKKNNDFSHDLFKKIIDNTYFIKLDVQCGEAGNLGNTISSNLFGSVDNMEINNWQILLSEKKPYLLSLEYGMGDANIDLSGLSIENMKIHTGSADINIGYIDGKFNLVEMDTFYLKVDLGSAKVNNLSNSRASNVIADVGIGDLMLDLSDPPKKSSRITGHVGAGTLTIKLPADNTPIKIVIKDSWLCSNRIPKSFKETDDDTYVNSHYMSSTKNSLTFEVDVSMGSLIFLEP